MKRLLILPLLAAVLATVPSHSNAQTNTNVTTATYEVAQLVNFTLTAYSQSTAGTASAIKVQAISTKSILSDLGALLGTNVSGDTLVAVTPLDVTNAVPDFQLRKGTTVLVDVSAFFTVTQLGTPVASSKASGEITAMDSITEYTYSGTNITFDVQGFTTATTQLIAQKRVVLGQASQVHSTVSGTGTIGVVTASVPAILQGSITISGRTVEPVPTSPRRRR